VYHECTNWQRFFVLQITPKSLQFSGKRVSRTASGIRFYKTDKATDYQNQIIFLAKKHAPKFPLYGPIRLDMVFVLPRPASLNRKKDHDGLIWAAKRPDRDNLIKPAQDALSRCGFWKDDSQICSGEILKVYCEKYSIPRIEVRITGEQRK